jgi:biopolymer transport protein ExbD
LARTQSKLSETKLDITPLVDCVFLLLIFFMVTTVFTTTPGLRVDLPKAAESDMPPEKDLIIKADKKTYHEVVVDVMDAAKGVGIDELAIATEPEEEEK